jgi:hypothetical protein
MKYFQNLISGVGAAFGDTFTASRADAQLITVGKVINELVLSLKGDAGAAVTTEAFADLVTPFTFKVGDKVRISLRGRDLIALHTIMYREFPTVFEATANGEDCKILGIRIPIYEEVKDTVKYAYSLTRAAVSNISGENVLLQAVYGETKTRPETISAVQIEGTTPGSTGETPLNMVFPKNGKLLGILLFNTTFPDINSDASTIQRLVLSVNGVRGSVLEVASNGLSRMVGGHHTGSPVHDALANYAYFDFSDAPIDCKANDVTVSIDVRATGEAYRIIPIMATDETA